MNLIKEFLYFTKSKLIIFILLAVALFYFMDQQNMILGNFTWSGLIIVLIVMYLFLDILWFSFKDKKHFLIGLAAFVILVGAIWLSDNYSTQKRAKVYESCLNENNSTSSNIEVMRCMSAKGYKKYR